MARGLQFSKRIGFVHAVGKRGAHVDIAGVFDLTWIAATETRRRVLQGVGGVVAATVLQTPFIRRAEAGPTLKIATYGGNFENSFIKYVYPEFTKATGITVESVSEPGTAQFLMQIAEANRAGVAPIDLVTASQADVLRGSASKLWRTFDSTRIPNATKLASRYVHTGANGIDAVGAMAWYTTLIINPDSVKPAPTSWKVLWDPKYPNDWGLASGGGSAIFEITAATWFGGNQILETEDGIMKVIGKIAELKPNVKLWWDSEGTMQTAYENDEVIGGMYFHDVAGVMAKSGTPVVSIFPQEGGVIDFGSWCQPSASTKTAEADQFVNFMCTPAAQALMSRHVGSAPLIDVKSTDLTPAEFAAVSSETPPITMAVEATVKHIDFMEAQFTKMLTS
jgi:putative spermidine/putrescine transport system substrate-binding protein